MAQDRELFREYDYDAHRKYQTAAENARAARAQLERLKKAQENNQEYLELNELVGRLSDEQKAVQSEYGLKLQEKSGQDSTIVRCAEKIEVKSAELNEQEECYRKYQIEHYTIVQRTVEAYEKYLENGKKGTGGLLAEETRRRITRSIEQHKSLLMQKQADYNAKHTGTHAAKRNGRERTVCGQKRTHLDGQSSGDPSEAERTDPQI